MSGLRVSCEWFACDLRVVCEWLGRRPYRLNERVAISSHLELGSRVATQTEHVSGSCEWFV